LNHIDDGLCDGEGSCIAGDGELGIDQAYLDSANRLLLAIRNVSLNQTVPSNRGDLRVFVDGHLVADIPLGTLTDQSYRQPRSSQVITLENVRITGENRRIGALLDSKNELIQRTENRNTLSVTLTPQLLVGPNLIVSDLLLAEDGTSALQVEVANIGTAPSPAQAADLHIEVDGSPVGTYLTDLPALEVGGTTTAIPAPLIQISSPARVAVSLETPSPLDELDTVDNTRTEDLPDGSYLDDYSALLSDPRVTSHMIWQTASGVVSFADWNTQPCAQQPDPPRMCDLIEKAIPWLEQDRPPDPELPPSLPIVDPTIPSALTEEQAWSIYVRQIAVSLWVEKNDLVAWSLFGLSDAERALVLDGRSWFSWYEAQGYYAASLPLGYVTPWHPHASYEFLHDLGLVKADQLSTIYALTEWATIHLRHNNVLDGDLMDLYGFAGLPLLERISYPLEGRDHVAYGCRCGSAFFSALLRTINIPVENAWSELLGCPPGAALHSRPYFPSVDLSTPHADNVFHVYFGGGVSGQLPAGDLYFSSAEMDALFLDPAVDCIGTTCNTLGEQASHNFYVYERQRCVDVLCTSIVADYALRGPAYVREQVLRDEFGLVYPPFSESEKDIFLEEIEAYLRLLGDGDLDAGIDAFLLRGAHPNTPESAMRALVPDPSEALRESSPLPGPCWGAY
jgi:hypothetical protein